MKPDPLSNIVLSISLCTNKDVTLLMGKCAEQQSVKVYSLKVDCENNVNYDSNKCKTGIKRY